MKLKYALLLLCIMVLGTLSGCGLPAEALETNEGDYEDVTTFFDGITGDMLDACNTLPSLNAYENDALVLLNWYNDDVRLYGISAGDESAMLLYVEGEKVLIHHPYRNMHVSYPKLSVSDADQDGAEEIIISRETLTGSPGFWYELLVCDNEDGWVVHDYVNYVEDIEAFIDYQYDDTMKKVTFLRNEDGTILTEIPLPDWTEEYPYAGGVDFADYIRFDAETMQMEVVPGILLENSMPYCSIKMIFNVRYKNGAFAIEFCEIQDS